MRDSIYGESPELNRVLSSASLIAATDVTVLINGESGTGKELLARAVHTEGPRKDRPFISVNCASLTDELADSALYGHKRGAFTGAVSDYKGFVGEADGGTLFLDEIGEMPLSVQARFLRFLESGECQPVGEAWPYQTDVRIVAATNRDLEKEVAAGRFREDLYYRLNVVPLDLPPLRERSGDLELLLQRLNSDLAKKHRLEPPRYTPAAIKVMERYAWPGNIRELRNLCERMTILRSGKTLDVTHLPAEIRASTDCEPSAQADAFYLPIGGVNLQDVETRLIQQALEREGGNRSRAARLLGLSRDTLLYRLKKYELTEYALQA
jgi:DNA-binding NtrC family response regulator